LQNRTILLGSASKVLFFCDAKPMQLQALQQRH